MRAPSQTIARARQLRRQLSPREARLWSGLRARSADLPIFRRQHRVGPYVLDFYCSKARLAVEIDGGIHDTEDHPERDQRRDAWLVSRGIAVVRIAASELARPVLRTVPLPRFSTGEDGAAPSEADDCIR